MSRKFWLHQLGIWLVVAGLVLFPSANVFAQSEETDTDAFTWEVNPAEPFVPRSGSRATRDVEEEKDVEATKLATIQVLVTPAQRHAVSATNSFVADLSTPQAETHYTVQLGDTLTGIAQKMYGDRTRWKAIYAANTEVIGANPFFLWAGQTLRIPHLTEPTTYLCASKQMSIHELAAYRGISPETFHDLQMKRGLTPADICAMPEAKLQRAIYRVANPKPDHPDEAVAFRKLTLQDENGYIPPDGLAKAAEHMNQMRAIMPPGAGINPTAWSWLGPGNIGGRARSLVIHPTNPNLMWLGSVAGGIWKTTDGGANWQVEDDFMTNMAVATLVMDPTNANVIYAGTGEGFYNFEGIRGAGVFKTTDGGVNWTQLASTANANWYYVNRLTVHPTNGQTLLAATRTGIWRTTNGGTSWTQMLTSETLDVNFDPSNSNNAIASGQFGQAWYSTNAGQTWTSATGLAGGRVEVAYAPNNPTIVYASVERNSGEIYKSANGGQSYIGPVNVASDAYLGGQGWYDNIIWVDPTNSDTIIVGGIDLWRSTNGGATLTKISQWWSAPVSAHADHHYILAHPAFNGSSNRTVFFVNDGGIYKTNDVYMVAPLSGWQELNNNLGIIQFYGAAGNPTTGVVVGGTQDNGTLRYVGGTETWTTMFGGDGGWSAADPTDPNYFYGEYVRLEIHRSTDGGATSAFIYNGIADAGVSANFIAPFILDPNNANTMLAGGDSLWRSTNVKAATPSWASIKPSPGSCCISAIAVAPGNSNIIWVGHNDGSVYKTTNGTASSPTWTRMDNNSPALPNRYVTRLTVDPSNANIVYATFGSFSADNVWRTQDGGTTWTDATGSGATGLPSVPVRSLVINASNTAWIYIGTEIGVFTSEDRGATWTLPHDGPTNTSVDELFWMGTDLYSATHGRGLFKVSPNPVMDVIFADGFESGNLSKWSASTTDGGDLSVSTAAKLVGNFGLQANIDDNRAIYVTDGSPFAEPKYRARFYFDPNSIRMASGNAHYIFYGYTGSSSTGLVRVELRYSGGTYQLRGSLLNDATTWRSSNWFTISDARHRVEISWRAATAAGANNGVLTLWIDGVNKASLTGVDNDTRRIGFIRLGAVASIDSGTRGTYYFDAFQSRRHTYIGSAFSNAAATDDGPLEVEAAAADLEAEAAADAAHLDTQAEAEIVDLDPLTSFSFDVDTLSIEVAASSETASALVITSTQQVAPPADHSVLGPLFTVQAFAADGSVATMLSQPATLMIDYSSTISDVTLLTDTLVVQAWNVDTGIWETLPTTMDAENHTVSVVIQRPVVLAITHQPETRTQRIYLPVIQR
jgi:hypothetical protein